MGALINLQPFMRVGDPGVLPSFIHNLKASNTTRLRERLLKVISGTGRLRCLALGDSTEAGPRAANATFQNGRFNSPSAAFAEEMKRRGVPTSFDSFTGIQGILLAEFAGIFHPKITTPAGWGATSTDGLAGRGLVNTTTTNPLALQCVGDEDTFELYYLRTASNSFGWVWNINGGPDSAEVNPIGTTLGKLVLTRDTLSAEALLTPGKHTLNIKKTAGSTGVALNFCFAYNSREPAIDIINAGYRGASTSDYTDGSITSPLACVRAVNADVVLINLGINNWRGGSLAGAQFTADMQAIINAAKFSGADVVLQAPFPSNPAVASPDSASLVVQQSYIAAIYALSASNDLPLIDRTQQFGSWDQANADGFAYDALHPNIAGYAKIGKEAYVPFFLHALMAPQLGY